jgi:raffinose/stachyose/melibiose transport system substrate-binding protein
VKYNRTRVRGLIASLLAGAAIAVPTLMAMPAHAATELTFWSWRPEDKAFYETQAANFQAATGISVKFTPYVATDYNAILATALTAGKGPDIMQIRAYGGMANLSDGGNFLALTTKDVPALAKIPKGTLAGTQGYTDKRQYGLPYATSVLGVMYNPDLLKKAGVKALPTTWSSFLATLDKVKAAGILPLGNGSGYAPGMEQLCRRGMAATIFIAKLSQVPKPSQIQISLLLYKL